MVITYRDIFSGSQSPAWLLESSGIQQIHALLSDRGAVAYNLLIDSEHAFKLFYRDLTRVFAHQTLSLPAQGYDNRLIYGFRHQPPRREICEYMQSASRLAELHDIDYHEILAAIFTSNPVGSGPI